MIKIFNQESYFSVLANVASMNLIPRQLEFIDGQNYVLFVLIYAGKFSRIII